jgi:sugar phosphate isomerase/epimerase
MPTTTRREFLGAVALAGAVLRPVPAEDAAPRVVSPAGAAPPPRLMTLDLVCGAIGVEASQREAVELAARHGFESVGAHVAELAGMSDGQIEELRDLMRSRRIVWGAADLGVDFRRDEPTFRRTAQDLAAVARALRRAGITRAGTWLPPASDVYTYRWYFDLVSTRLREVARVLDGEGLRLGLEYVAPRTAWASRRYPFIHTLAETCELVSVIGVRGVGYVLDSWHWYHAGDSAEQIRDLRGRDVVAVHLNDAPADTPRDEQKDSPRALPLATGIIPLAPFLRALRDIGYDGPVRAEPFDAALNAMPAEQAVATTAAALKKALALLG